MASALGCKRFFFSGSQAEYGLCSELTSECHNCLPISEYGKAKLAFGNWAAECSRYLTMKYYHLRIFSVYGPGDHEYSLVNTCVDRFASGEVMEFGECTQKWNYMFIDDCVEAITSLMVSESDGGIYNIASNDTRQLKDYISEINRIYGGNGTAVYGVKPPNAEGVTSLIPDISKLMNAANWYPKTSFCDGIVKIRRP